METTALVSTASAWSDAATRSIFAAVSLSFGSIVSQLTNAVVESLSICDAMAHSNAQRWVKFALMPTISTLVIDGCRAADSCQAPWTDELPAHPESHATPMITSVVPTRAFLFRRRRRP